MPKLKAIPSTLGIYLAGDDGHIYSRANKNGGLKKLKERTQGSCSNLTRRGKYFRVTISINGRSTQRSVHRLVAEAWLEDFHPLLEVHHINEDSTDNRPSNLQCMTRAEHEKAHGHWVIDADIVNARYDFELHKEVKKPPVVPLRKKRTPHKRTHPMNNLKNMIKHVEYLEGKIND